MAWAALGALPVLLTAFVLLGGLERPLLSTLYEGGNVVSGRFFDAQALALADGRMDVPCVTLGSEAIMIERRCYGYFGITPSLLRLPLDLVFPSLVYHWGRVMMMAAALLSYAAAWGLAWRALDGAARQAQGATGFAVIASAGTSLVFLLGNPFPYHEAIAWGAAFALAALWAFGEYARRPLPWLLVLGLLAAALSLNARVTVGLAAVAAGAVALGQGWLVTRDRRLAGLLAGGVVLLAVALSPLAVNWLRFEQASPPLERQVFFRNNPARLALLEQGIFRPDNLACTLSGYLSLDGIRFSPAFPWVGPDHESWTIPSPPPPGLPWCGLGNTEHIEPFYALPYTAPALFVLTIIGFAPMAGWRQRLRLWGGTYAAGLAGAVPIFLFFDMSNRYLHDAFPALVIGGVMGIAAIMRMERAGMRRGLLAAAALLGVAGWYLNAAAALVHIYPPPEILRLLATLRRVFG